MKRLKPIPEGFESGRPTANDGQGTDLASLVQELKQVLQQPRSTERELLKAISGLRDILGSRPNGANARGGSASGPPLRLGVFADTANLTDRVSKDPTVLDYQKLLRQTIGDRRLVHARAYCPIYSDYGGRLEEQRSVAPVWGTGFDIVTKPVKVFADGTRKADLDLVLAMDVIRRLDTMDVMALMSGDGDFVPLVELVREKGVRVELYCFVESLAQELRLAANAFFDLHELKEVHAAKAAAARP